MFLHTLFLEYATETGGNKCKAVFYTYKQIGMPSLELFWPCSILAKNLGDVLARGLSIAVPRGTVYNRRENLRFFGIPESTTGAERENIHLK